MSVEETVFTELIPVDQFEWIRIVRRIQMPSGVKYLGLMMATYADPDGTSVRPGVEGLALVMCVSVPTVKRSLASLRSLGLIERVKQGNRHLKHADEYRLTVPPNLLALPMLGPDERPASGDQQ